MENCGMSIQWNITQPLTRNGLLIHVTTFTNLGNIILCERSQIHESISVKYPEKENSQRQNVDSWLPGAQGRRNGGVSTKSYEGFF